MQKVNDGSHRGKITLTTGAAETRVTTDRMKNASADGRIVGLIRRVEEAAEGDVG